MNVTQNSIQWNNVQTFLSQGIQSTSTNNLLTTLQNWLSQWIYICLLPEIKVVCDLHKCKCVKLVNQIHKQDMSTMILMSFIQKTRSVKEMSKNYGDNYYIIYPCVQLM